MLNMLIRAEECGILKSVKIDEVFCPNELNLYAWKICNDLIKPSLFIDDLWGDAEVKFIESWLLKINLLDYIELLKKVTYIVTDKD